MKTSPARTILRLMLALLLGGSAALAQAPASAPLSAQTRAQIDAIRQDAAARTPAQRKITSSLLYAAREKATGNAAVAGAPKLHARVNLETDGRVRVKIKADVTPELLGAIRAAGGTVTASFPKYRAINATVPLTALETIASRPEVAFIGLPPAVKTNRAQPSFSQIFAPQEVDTPFNDPEGDGAHGAATVRSQFGATGNGIKVGVLSDSLDDAQGDYGTALEDGYVSTVNVVPGQGGDTTNGEAEGLAMLEIVHRIAPGAQLYFASGFNGEEQMASNISTLVSDGCKIIIDDVSYGDESPFQEDTISTAVQAASDAGVLYFSSAANFGNLDSGTSSCWEGDFVGSTTAPTMLDFEAGQADSPQTSNAVTDLGGDPQVSVVLFWSDPLGKTVSSYTLYEMDGAGNVVQSANDNSGDPIQIIDTFAPNDFVAVGQDTGPAKFLHVDIFAQNSTLQYATDGHVRGHNAGFAANSFAVAATPAAQGVDGGPNGPYPNGVFNSSNGFEVFSNDGPRRIFYHPDGSAITPGNLTSSGGQLLLKPDFTAADGVATSDVNINPFYGTSAAAPHAGALAALALSYNTSLTAAQATAALRAGTVQINSPGANDRDAGAGILLAANIIQAVSVPPTITGFSPTGGLVGSTVTVTGTALGGVVSVTLNGTAVAYTLVSSTTLTFTVPAGATSGPIVVQTIVGTATSATSFTVMNATLVPVITSAPTANGQIGTVFSYQITATNNPTTFSATGLPNGLTVSSTGLISGVPTAAGTFTVALFAGNTIGGTGTATLTLTILPLAPVITSVATASGQVGVPFTFQVTASNAPTSFAASGLPAGLTIRPANGRILGTPTAAGTFAVTVSATNMGGTGSSVLTLTVLPPPPVITSVLTASGRQGTAFTYAITATNSPTLYVATGLPAGLTLNPTTGVISGTPSDFGSFTVTITVTNTGGGASAVLALTILEGAPVFSNALVAEGKFEEPFSLQLSASNNPTNFAAAGLPPGLGINGMTGVISGKPTAGGHFKVTISATDAGGTRNTFLTIVVSGPPTVSVTAPIPLVGAATGATGKFLLRLSQAVSKPTLVHFVIEGSAENGKDYVHITATRQIKPGKTTKPIVIAPLDNFAGTRVVKIILRPGTGYRLHKPTHARVRIVGDE